MNLLYAASPEESFFLNVYITPVSHWKFKMTSVITNTIIRTNKTIPAFVPSESPEGSGLGEEVVALKKGVVIFDVAVVSFALVVVTLVVCTTVDVAGLLVVANFVETVDNIVELDDAFVEPVVVLVDPDTALVVEYFVVVFAFIVVFAFVDGLCVVAIVRGDVDEKSFVVVVFKGACVVGGGLVVEFTGTCVAGTVVPILSDSNVAQAQDSNSGNNHATMNLVKIIIMAV